MILPEATLRELGAEHRTFQTVRKAMIFYRDELCRRLSVSRGFEVGLAPRSRQEREEAQATCAAVARCVVGNHWSDDSIASPRMRQELPLEQVGILFLVAHYENTESDGADLAQQWEWQTRGVRPGPENNPTWRFIRWCRVIERVLQHRMSADRLLEAE